MIKLLPLLGYTIGNTITLIYYKIEGREEVIFEREWKVSQSLVLWQKCPEFLCCLKRRHIGITFVGGGGGGGGRISLFGA